MSAKGKASGAGTPDAKELHDAVIKLYDQAIELAIDPQAS